MRTILNKLAAALLFCVLGMSPLLAQTNPPMEVDTNISHSDSEELAREKLQLDKDLATDRINADKDLAERKSDAHESMVHDIAWSCATASWILVVIAVVLFGYLRDKRRHETIRLMVEKGASITPELLAGLRKDRPPRPGHDPRGYLGWGVILTAVGTALLFVNKVMGPGGWIAGWIVLAVGVAYFVLWVIERIYSNNDQSK